MQRKFEDMSSLASVMKMKSLGRRFNSARKGNNNPGERERLVSGSVGQSDSIPNYQTQASFERVSINNPSNPDLLAQTGQSSSPVPVRIQRPVSPTVARYAAQNKGSGQGRKLSTSSSPPSSPPPVATADLEIDFDQVPFQFYCLVVDKWKSPILQAATVLLLCLVVPSPVFFLGIIINEIRMAYKPRQKPHERKMYIAVISFTSVLLAGKDMLAIKLFLYLRYHSPTSGYEIAYSLPGLLWILFCVVFPVAIFKFAEPKYSFGTGVARKGSVFEAFPILSAQATTVQARKEDELDKTTNSRYKSLLGITSAREELSYVLKCTSSRLFNASYAAALILCVAHCLPPAIFQLIDSGSSYRINATIIKDGKNATYSTSKYLAVIATTLTSTLLLSIPLAATFVYVSLWKIAVLNEWTHFNKYEADSKKTLIASGPGGIARWWRIRQLLVFLMDSKSSLSALLGHSTFLYGSLYIVCSSGYIFSTATSTSRSEHTHRVILILIDNSFICAGVIALGVLSWLSHRQKLRASDLLRLKQLNVAYELGRLMNLDQETIHLETQVRSSIRVLRGCLMLLQEMTPSLERLNVGFPFYLQTGCVSISVLLVASSSYVAVRNFRG